MVFMQTRWMHFPHKKYQEMHPAREEASLLLLFPPGQRSSPLGEEGHYATLRGVKSQLRHEPNDRTREGKTDCKTAPISFSRSSISPARHKTKICEWLCLAVRSQRACSTTPLWLFICAAKWFSGVLLETDSL